MTAEEITAAIRRFLEERHGRPGPALTDTTDLVEDWLPDSLALVELVLFLEKTFDARLASTDIQGGAFKDLRSLTALVEARRPKP